MPWTPQAILEQLNVIVTIANSVPLDAIEEVFRAHDADRGKILAKIVDASSRYKYEAGHEALAAFVQFRRALKRAEQKALQTVTLAGMEHV